MIKGTAANQMTKTRLDQIVMRKYGNEVEGEIRETARTVYYGLEDGSYVAVNKVTGFCRRYAVKD